MPQLSTFPLNDGTANRTFSLDSVIESKGLVTREFVYKPVGSTPMGFHRVRFTHRPGGLNESGAAQFGMSIEVPTVIPASGTSGPVLSHTCRYANGKAYLPNKASPAELVVLANYTKNLPAVTEIVTVISTAEPLR